MDKKRAATKIVESPPIETLCIDADIADSEEALISADEKFRAIFENVHDLISYVDTNGKILDVNSRIEGLLGYKREDIIGRNFVELGLVNLEVPKLMNLFSSSIQKNEEKKIMALELRHRNGNIVSVEVGTRFIRNKKGKIVSIVNIFRDVTGDKKAKAALIECEEKFRYLAEESPNMIFINKLGRVVYANKKCEEITGYSKEEFYSPEFDFLSLNPPEYVEVVKAAFVKHLNLETVDPYEYELITKDGKRINSIISTSLIEYKGGKAILGIVTDITERKNVEKQLIAASLYSRSLIEASLDPLVTISKEGIITDVNVATEKVTGCSRLELVGSDFSMYFTEPEKARIVYLKVFTEGLVRDYPLAIRHKSGLISDVLYNASIYRNPEGEIHGVLATARDITERKKSEIALLDERNKFESVAKAIGAGLVIIDKDYHVIWANDFIKRYKGDTVGKLCYASLNDLNGPCSDCGIVKIFAGRTSFDSHEYCSTNVNGDPYWVQIVATPITDDQGNVTSAVEIAIDITERKKAEEHRKILERKVKNYSEHLKCMVDLRTAQLKDANERLVKAERFAAIGELSGMIGHDLRNPLAGIKNAIYFLKKKGQTISEAQTKEMFEIIDKAIDHSDKIINDLLDYSREMHLELIKYSARTLVDETMQEIQVPERIKIVNRVQQEDLVWVNPDKMLRVFINLVNNAIDAMPEKGTLEISSCHRDCWIDIVFADTGMGIPEETMQKIFTPLFTTKAQGMGFGLAICKRIIEAHGGTIKVKTKLNQGTTFTNV
jgi:PAS domain S-box-containing protein